ncbi:hypothetical protein MKW98_002296, partial [Papaver atlanticum]
MRKRKFVALFDPCRKDFHGAKNFLQKVTHLFQVNLHLMLDKVKAVKEASTSEWGHDDFFENNISGCGFPKS